MREIERTEPSERLCISVPEAAGLLGISRNSAYEMVKLGQLPTIRCGQRRLIVPMAAFNKMLEGGDRYHGQEKEEQISRQDLV